RVDLDDPGVHQGVSRAAQGRLRPSPSAGEAEDLMSEPLDRTVPPDAMMPPLRKLWHLTKRFMGQLSGRGPTPADDAWATSWLLPAEQEVWWRLRPADRRHAAAVARHAYALLDDEPSRAVMAGIVLHDCGKVDSSLGPFGRAAAMVKSGLVGRQRAEE